MPRSGHRVASAEAPPSGQAPVTAWLGPTNTGKTHRAIERLLECRTGIIGLPLRLLAREVYDRMTARIGEGAVALVTGEEKRVPAHPRYWVCTVEAMPAPESLPGGAAELVAIDEIQLAGDRERGHVFTDRLLHARGTRETYLMGSDTIRPLLHRLVPEATVESRPRLSALTGAGSLTVGALPPRSAVVAFSAGRVYELGERLRARRGGAAIVLGALSPRVRNAQVAMYQAGEVDYMVATDAIGLGLNMDVECVAFADLHKFDGRTRRLLLDAELAQIAGRAGRHTNDGRFATLDPLPPLGPRTTRAIERHRFEAQKRVFWRPHVLDFTSMRALQASLRQRPTGSHLAAADDAEDGRALAHLAREPEVVARAIGRPAVALLWQVCQVPDFRAIKCDDHFQLLRSLYLQLSSASPRLTNDWMARHVAPLDDVAGDIDTLLRRMAGIRTWTYVSNQSRWVADAEHWQGETRVIEDRLSDAVHERLVQRFVDARATRRPRLTPARPSGLAGAPASASASDSPLATPRPSAPPTFAELLRAHIGAESGQAGGETVGGDTGPKARASGGEPGSAGDEAWVRAWVAAPHSAFRLEGDERIAAGDEIVARLAGGVDLLRPEVTLVTERAIGAGARLRLGRRLLAWTRDLVAELVTPLRSARDGAELSPAARGLLYQLEQSLGTVSARDAIEQLRALDPASRARLGRLGVRLGEHVVYVPALLNPGAIQTRAALCNAYLTGTLPGPRSARVRIEPPRPGAVSLRVAPAVPTPAYAAIGYPVFGSRAIRADLVDAVGARLRGRARAQDVASRLGCPSTEVESVRAAFA
jgi:ATP-dependent RNA helicase SUPV3L1/SUV3